MLVHSTVFWSPVISGSVAFCGLFGFSATVVIVTFVSSSLIVTEWTLVDEWRPAHAHDSKQSKQTAADSRDIVLCDVRYDLCCL